MSKTDILNKVKKYYTILLNSCIKYSLDEYPDSFFFFYDDNLLRKIKFSKITNSKIKINVLENKAIAELDLKNKVFWLIDNYSYPDKILLGNSYGISTNEVEDIIISVATKKFNLDTLTLINKSKIWKIENYKNEQKK